MYNISSDKSKVSVIWPFRKVSYQLYMLDNGRLISCLKKLVKHLAEFVNGTFVHLMIFFKCSYPHTYIVNSYF